MDEYLKKNSGAVKEALRVGPDFRSYDDILLLKAWLMKSEFYTKNLAHIANPHQMNDICRYLELVEYHPGDVVFNQGDIGNMLYILFDGSCNLRVRYKIDLTQGQSEIREKLILTYDTVGQYFGERALQYDEPRSGTVICQEPMNLVTVSKASYTAVLKAAKMNPAWKIDGNAPAPPSTKETVIAVLSKMRNRRSNQELDSVASYLHSRIPFFQKFTMHQLVELCRVCETISVDSRKVLFKQGQIGQAFYVVLSGTVEVWVRNAKKMQYDDGESITLRHKKVTAGLGSRVNELIAGEAFGERALESDDSMRMASIVTCDGVTDLIAIAREDYHNFVFVMQKSDTMKRLALLRKTELFRPVDVMHLKDLARFMRPKEYQFKEVLYRAGQKAVEIIIIESGECRVETEVREGIDLAEQARRHRLKTAPHYMQPTQVLDGTYHEGEEGFTPFHEDPYHQHHHELAHRHPITTKHSKRSPLPSPRIKSKGDVSATKKDRIKSVKDQESLKAQMDDVTGEVEGKLIIDTSIEDDMLLSTKSPQESTRFHPNSPMPTSASAATFQTLTYSGTQLNTTEEMKDGTDAADKDDAAMKQLGTGSVYNLKLKRKDRLRTVEMVESRVRTVNLGRIAPNTVLATYITAGSLQDDIFHPESVIADSFVTAKTDFFNHLSRDAHDALVHVIADFKPPEMLSLWQNAPRQLNEAEWKREKTWKVYKKKLLNSDKLNVDILNTYRHFGNVHLSANSGNDDYTSINQKNKRLREARELRKGGTHVVVTSDWGLRPRHQNSGVNEPETENNNTEHLGAIAEHEKLDIVASVAAQAAKEGHLGAGRYLHLTEEQAAMALGDENAVESTRRKSMVQQHAGSRQARRFAQLVTMPGDEQTEIIAPNDAQDGTQLNDGILGQTSSTADATSIIVSTAVSSMLQKRLKDAHYNEVVLKKELFVAYSPRPDPDAVNPLAQYSPRSSIQHFDTPKLSPTANLISPNRGGRSLTKKGLLTEDGVGFGNILETESTIVDGFSVLDEDKFYDGSLVYAYQLIQLHKSLAGKPVIKHRSGGPRIPKYRIYMRLCGGSDCSIGAKALAESQMEFLALSSLFRKDPTRNEQLYLQWKKFSGFGELPLNYTDHFIVYHKDTPTFYASINPSKNIFNAVFPSMCKPDNHRFACAVLKTEWAVPTLQPDRQASSEMRTDEDNNVDSRETEKNSSRPVTSLGMGVRFNLSLNMPPGSNNIMKSTDFDDNQERINTVDSELHEQKSEEVNIAKSESRDGVDSVGSFLTNDSRDYMSRSFSVDLNAIRNTEKGASSYDHQDPTASAIEADTNSDDISCADSIVSAQTEENMMLKEIGVVEELLLTSFSKVDCLRYAIRRFGSLADQNSVEKLPTESTAVTQSSTIGIPSVGLDAKIYLRPLETQCNTDKILNSLHQETKRVCIVPLFHWILINEDTINSIDFVNGFNRDPGAKVLYMQNEADGITGKSHLFRGGQLEDSRLLLSRDGRRSSGILDNSLSMSNIMHHNSSPRGKLSKSVDSLPVASAGLNHNNQSLLHFVQSREKMDTSSHLPRGTGRLKQSSHITNSGFVSKYSDSAAAQGRLHDRFAELEHIHRTRFQKVTLESVTRNDEDSTSGMNDTSTAGDTNSVGSPGYNRQRKKKNMNLSKRKQLLTASFMSQGSQDSGASSFNRTGSNSGKIRSRVPTSIEGIITGGLSGGAHGGAYVVGAVGRRLEQNLQSLAATFPSKHEWAK